MHRIVEVLLLEARIDPVVGLVVEQDGAQQRLLGLQIMRRDARLRGRGRDGKREGLLGRHRPQDGAIRGASCLRSETLTSLFPIPTQVFVLDLQQ